eukprot:TRINITY_DN1353_c0_g1_i1.p1 TRINITY_DN1353_c0_g1~~TRINITY_DN1353_c0_g1_i1.p1  ORF type:complete len:537 (+),score=145.40 TRINITY_DN1353_c0_g1_i1:71-1681(+)
MGVSDFRREMLRRKKEAAAAAKGGEDAAVVLVSAAGDVTHRVALDACGGYDTAWVEEAFGLDNVYLETPQGGLAVQVVPGGRYVVHGDDRTPPLVVCGTPRVGFGCAIDEALRHAPPDPTQQHPERPERVAAALKHVEADAVFPHLTLLHPSQLAAPRGAGACLWELPAPPAPAQPYPYHLYPQDRQRDADAARLLAAVRSVHTDTLVRNVLPSLLPYPQGVYEGAQGQGAWAAKIGCDGAWSVPQDTYRNAYTSDAVGASLKVAAHACGLLERGGLDTAFCLVRPPGHHCTCGQPQGFCWVNNAAVCARYLQLPSGGAALPPPPARRRIAIVDFDVHHGDGTQAIFEDDPSVLFISLHRYDAGRFYPHTGPATQCGTGPGVGANVNIAFDTAPHTERVIGDTAFAVAADEMLVPLLRAWRPDHLIISAGFDAAQRDPLGRMSVVHGFHYMTSRLVQAVPSTLLLLEGGYHPDSVAKGVVGCLRALVGAPPPPYRHSPEQAEWTRATLRATADAHAAANSPMSAAHSAIRDRLAAA